MTYRSLPALMLPQWVPRNVPLYPSWSVPPTPGGPASPLPRAWGPPARLSLGHEGQRSHSALGFYDVYFPRSESRAGWGDCPSLRAAPGRSHRRAGG